jgi:hypothetical protein
MVGKEPHSHLWPPQPAAVLEQKFLRLCSQLNTQVDLPLKPALVLYSRGSSF